jgi:hypothetical protein
VGKSLWENPRANGLVKRAGSCAHPIPYVCMSAPVRFMVGVWVVFYVVVSPVFGSSIPVVSKLVLRGSATEPPKAHIHHLAHVWDNSIVNNPFCCGVLCLNGAFWLGPSHVDVSPAVGNHLWAVINRAASSDLAADAITNLMIRTMESTAPLNHG